MVSNGNRSRDGIAGTARAGVSGGVFIDDLEIPSKKAQSLDDLCSSLFKSHGPLISGQFRDLAVNFRNKRVGAFELLGLLEGLLGFYKGFKYYWGLCLTQTYDAVILEMHKTMRKSVIKMSFRVPDCILAVCRSSYWEIFSRVTECISQFMYSVEEKMEPYEEYRIDTMLGAMFAIETGRLAQGRGLQNFVTARSLPFLLQVYFANETGVSELLGKVATDDLVPAYLYFCVLKIKSSGNEELKPPDNTGVFWLYKMDNELDIDCIPIEGKNGMPLKAKSRAMHDEFPSLETGPVLGKSLMDVMKEQASRKKVPQIVQPQRAQLGRVLQNNGELTDIRIHPPKSGNNGPNGMFSNQGSARFEQRMMGSSPESRAIQLGFPVFPIPLLPLKESIQSKTRKKIG